MCFKKLLLGLCILILSGCAEDRTATPAKYYKQPNSPYASPPPVRKSPDYYYNQPRAAYPAQQPYGYRAPAPASRTYNDPYAFQPSPQYPYYDSDNYYVPPNFYGSPDNVIGGGGGIHGL